LLKVSHWCPTDHNLRDEAWLIELSGQGRRALLALWRIAEKQAGKVYSLPVPENPPTNSELYVEPDILESSPDMSAILRECAALAGEAGAEEIRLPCPSTTSLDTSKVKVQGRQFAFAWMRKELRQGRP
jgi:hypothetical protein